MPPTERSGALGGSDPPLVRYGSANGSRIGAGMGRIQSLLPINRASRPGLLGATLLKPDRHPRHQIKPETESRLAYDVAARSAGSS